MRDLGARPSYRGSAMLNKAKLVNYQLVALAGLIRSNHVQRHNLVLVGHSLGSIAARRELPCAGIVLIQPPLSSTVILPMQTFNNARVRIKDHFNELQFLEELRGRAALI
ncbi:hypothetical protein Moror_11202 [Moniliophthora roreri MCA 2997]|uniref:Uncharacterized protein n=1 Tax=Moniliophthora roreri (strain MCA 2997) TaxID=1381753 RepID=V2W777_MONRO|nr:hypothetical protein Moror_11202 [Moniliophthora roreri MCA 2997]